VYFPATEIAADHKVSTLMSAYPSQLEKDWFSEETFRAIMRLRGLECRSDTGLAEAFYASKIVVA
ncbi:MAG: PIG-L family deacetylase, partial [Gammaproteobacteria bacterium]|nr:PIG-L family deacetylase [Gammaproteobacteria bacterium]